MPDATRFTREDIVGLFGPGFDKAENAFLEDARATYGQGPFYVQGIIEDRNGSQLHVITTSGDDAILPHHWFKKYVDLL